MSTAPSNITRSELSNSTTPSSGTVVSSELDTVPITSDAISAYTYSDLSLVWESGSSEFVFDRDSIKQSVLLILGTNKRTRWFRPDFGADLERLLFEPLDYTTANKLKTNIENALKDRVNGDTRISINSLEVIPDIENNQFYVNLLIDVPSLGLKHEPIEFGLVRQ